MEVGTREFLARCLTSCVAAERGFTVLLGHQYTLLEHATVFPPGIYLSKGTNAISTTNMKLAKKSGHVNAACEEENFFRVLQGNPIFCSDRHLPEVCDAFLTMGQEETDFMHERFGEALKVFQCGNARADILRPEFRSFFDDDVRALKERFGRYILVNSNLGITNSSSVDSSPDDIFASWIDSEIFDPALSVSQRKNIFEDFVSFEKGNAQMLRNLLSELAQREFSVVLRPHPGENKVTWKKFVSDLNTQNIECVSEGSHIPAILGADLVVHTACTTGVESLLLDIPALSAWTTGSHINDYYLSNRFNVTADSVADAIEQINRFMAGDTAISDARPELMKGMSHYLDALESGPLAADQIVDVLEDLSMKTGEPKYQRSTSRQEEPSIITESKHFSEGQFFRQKYGVTPELMENTVGRFKEILGRFQDVHAEQLSESVWKISR